jgi:uncharacterized protein YjiK
MNMKTSILGTLALAVVFTACNKNNDDRTNTPLPGNTDTTAAGSLYISNADTLSSGIGVVRDLEAFSGFSSLSNGNTDGNGIALDETANTLFQLGRKNGQVLVYNNASGLSPASTPTGSFTVSGLTSGRELAFDDSRNILYIANNSDSTIHVINSPAGKSGVVTADKVFKLNGQPWGIAYDAKNDRLFVAKDQTTMFQIYNTVSSIASGAVTPARQVSITGASRVHGIAYDTTSQTLIVTDIANATGTGFNTDGRIYVLTDLENPLVVLLNLITPLRTLSGAATTLGNPVDVAFDSKNIYVAEKANNKVLKFAFNATGNVAPAASIDYPKIPESIFLGKK